MVSSPGFQGHVNMVSVAKDLNLLAEIALFLPLMILVLIKKLW